MECVVFFFLGKDANIAKTQMYVRKGTNLAK